MGRTLGACVAPSGNWPLFCQQVWPGGRSITTGEIAPLSVLIFQGNATTASDLIIGLLLQLAHFVDANFQTFSSRFGSAVANHRMAADRS